MSAPLASYKSTSRRRDLALSEIDALATNLIHDARALERRLIALAPGLAVAAYADVRLIEAGADVIRCEVAEARR